MVLKKFTENLVDDCVPSSAHRDAPASSSRESASEPRRKVVSGKHSIFTRFPKDRNSDICLRTKITRAPCRKRSGAAVLRAENFGDLIPAVHKVFSEGCESRHNHRYAFVVQDLDTQWIQAYPCKMKKSPRGPRQSNCLSPSSWSRQRSQKSLTPTITWNLANPVNNYLGIIVRLHLI